MRDLTTGRVAKMIGCASRTVTTWVDKGLIPGSYRLPNSQDRRIPVAALIRFIQVYGVPMPPELEDFPVSVADNPPQPQLEQANEEFLSSINTDLCECAVLYSGIDPD